MSLMLILLICRNHNTAVLCSGTDSLSISEMPPTETCSKAYENRGFFHNENLLLLMCIFLLHETG